MTAAQARWGALLDNPRLTEGTLMPLLLGTDASPEVLALVAAHRRWGVRREIRAALCRNRRTPPATALALLPLLGKRELREVAGDPLLAAVVRRRARLLLGEA